ncbi:MAG TPA: PRTRC system protein C [Thermomicrobiales bacterium]|nr:PRTRC system protein C [Thermomicrobiales bacterium]
MSETTPTATSTTAPATPARVFVFDGKEYPDPDPALAPDRVRQELARFIPELTNADTREETRRDGVRQIVFTKRIGTKGAHEPEAGVDADDPDARAGDAGPAQAAAPAARGTLPAPPGVMLLGILRQIPEKRLAVYRLGHELARPTGEFDLDAAAGRADEVARAGDEARAYALATGQARRALGALLRRRG